MLAAEVERADRIAEALAKEVGLEADAQVELDALFAPAWHTRHVGEVMARVRAL